MGIIGKAKLILIIIGIVVVGFVAKDITSAGIEDYQITGISGIDSSGFNVNADIVVNNPTKIPVNVETVRYKAKLRDTGETVSTGTLKNLQIPKEQKSTISISPRINWIPGSNTLLRYGTQDEVWMDIDVDVVVFGFLPAASITVPVDIKEVFQFSERNPSIVNILDMENQEDKITDGLLNSVSN